MTTTSYRGYLIGRNDLADLWWIERSGTFIGWALDVSDAQRIIDTLLED